jgi:hypothetical protein
VKIQIRDTRDGWKRPKAETDPNRCPETTTDDQFRTHRVIRCQKAKGHEGPHFAAVGGSQAWRQYHWPWTPEMQAYVEKLRREHLAPDQRRGAQP